MNSANLFVIGSPKSGTTSIVKYLESSSSVFIPKIKEPNFYSRELLRAKCNSGTENLNIISNESEIKNITHAAIVDDRSVYESLYKSNNLRYACDASTSYCLKKEIIDDILKDNSKAKIILCIRNPLERILSHQVMDEMIGYDVKSLTQKEIGLCNYSLDYILNTRNYRLFSDYDYIINHVLSNVDEDNLLILELGKLGSKETIIRISNFLNLNLDPDVKITDENKSKTPRFKGFNKLISNLGIKLFIQKFFPKNVKKILSENFYSSDTSKDKMVFKPLADKICGTRILRNYNDLEI